VTAKVATPGGAAEKERRALQHLRAEWPFLRLIEAEQELPDVVVPLEFDLLWDGWGKNEAEEARGDDGSW
jgi:hypothetical protein